MSSKTALRLIVSISGVMFLFGLTWLFAALTININGSNVVRIVFQILFTVSASFQGFFIFLFFVIFNREARESWREIISCGHYKSEFLHPSQYKNTNSAGTGTGTGTRTPKANTSTTDPIGNSYIYSNYNTVNLESEASPHPEKTDLSKNDEKQTDIPLTSTSQVLAEEVVSNFSPPNIVESQVDEDEEMTTTNWLLDATPVARPGSSKEEFSNHRIENGDSDDQEVREA